LTARFAALAMGVLPISHREMGRCEIRSARNARSGSGFQPPPCCSRRTGARWALGELHFPAQPSSDLVED
jgi:hypothetical protein